MLINETEERVLAVLDKLREEYCNRCELCFSKDFTSQYCPKEYHDALEDVRREIKGENGGAAGSRTKRNNPQTGENRKEHGAEKNSHEDYANTPTKIGRNIKGDVAVGNAPLSEHTKPSCECSSPTQKHNE